MCFRSELMNLFHRYLLRVGSGLGIVSGTKNAVVGKWQRVALGHDTESRMETHREQAIIS